LGIENQHAVGLALDLEGAGIARIDAALAQAILLGPAYRGLGGRQRRIAKQAIAFGPASAD
jgi:hypothetical protein